MAFNNRGLWNQDARRLFSGKDALLLSADDGQTLATVDSFQAQVTFNSTQFQPLGSPIQQEFLTGYSVSLTISECVIEDNRFVRELFEFFQKGRHSPHWNFAGVVYGYNNSTSFMVFRDCIPSGNLDLMNITIGEIWKRSWTLHVQQPPTLQSLLSYV